jgi:hypothetical protein
MESDLFTMEGDDDEFFEDQDSKIEVDLSAL